MRQQSWQVAENILSWWGVKRLLQTVSRLRPVDCTQKVWTLQELNIGSEIGHGHTGKVYEGCINGQRVAVKVRSSAS